MDLPLTEEKMLARLKSHGLEPAGIADFHVLYPASCASEREGSKAFNLRLADFETSVIGEILQTSMQERNALLDCVDHLEQRARTKLYTNVHEREMSLLDPSPQAKLPFTLVNLRELVTEVQKLLAA